MGKDVPQLNLIQTDVESAPGAKMPRKRAAVVTDCSIEGFAGVRLSLENVAQLRKQPSPPFGAPLPANFLKHAEEQTIAALTAVYRAKQNHGVNGDLGFKDWGVVACPRFLGRPAMAASLPRFFAEGAWAVSPHMIPHRSLHSISGTISQALKIHGPNYGVGGGPGGEQEALLSAVSLLEAQRLPGVWLVFTRLDPELVPDLSGAPTEGTECIAFAVALRPAAVSQPNLRLRLQFNTYPPVGYTEGVQSSLDLAAMQSAVERAAAGESSGLLVAGGGCQIQISQAAAPQNYSLRRSA
jgi:hypothetical protein